MKFQLFIVLSSLLLVIIQALDNGLARTPPMGWMSWQRFRCITDCNLYPDDCISDKLIRKMADLMSSEGYLEAGYEYLVIDDCWLAYDRDEQGRMQPDPVRFPHGMNSLADYIHSKGLKFGMYQDYGTLTCAGYPGIKGHLEIDAKTFVEWEIDYIKMDGCNAPFDEMEGGFVEFGKYLNQSGRPVVYSCGLPLYFELNGVKVNYELMAETCNLWRNWKDIQDSHNSFMEITDWYGKESHRFESYAGPGGWNDPDELLVGGYGLSYEQSKAHMAIWSILAAPLFMSVDFRTIRNEDKEILLNKEALAINQDPLGIQGKKIASMSSIDVWIRPITPVVGGSRSYAIAFHSRREDGYPFAIQVKLADMGLDNAKGYTVTNVFEPENSEDVVQTNNQFIVRVRPSGVVFIKATPIGA